MTPYCTICKWVCTHENKVIDRYVASTDGKIESVTKKDEKTHTVVKACKCGDKYVSEVEHNFVNDVCSDCGYKRVVPGKISGLKFKKVKSVKKKGKYKITYKVTFKKAKNAKYYEITYYSKASGSQSTKKIKSGGIITITTGKKGTTSITLNAVSNTGNKSSVSKKLKYKN